MGILQPRARDKKEYGIDTLFALAAIWLVPVSFGWLAISPPATALIGDLARIFLALLAIFVSMGLLGSMIIVIRALRSSRQNPRCSNCSFSLVGLEAEEAEVLPGITRNIRVTCPECGQTQSTDH